jgi:hypothetical protein
MGVRSRPRSDDIAGRVDDDPAAARRRPLRHLSDDAGDIR